MLSINKPVVLIILTCFFILSCHKELSPVNTMRTPAQKMATRERDWLTSIERQSDRQGTTEVFNVLSADYENGRMSSRSDFRLSDGSFLSAHQYTYNRLGYLAKNEIKGEGHINYSYDENGRVEKASFFHNSITSKNYTVLYSIDESERTTKADRYDYQNRLQESIVFKYNTDGTPMSVEYFEPDFAGRIQWKARKLLYHSANPKQVGAWQQTVRMFPEPQLPWILDLLICDKIEMQGNHISTVSNEIISDGTTIRRGSLEKNDLRGKLLRITVKDGGTTDSSTIEIPLLVKYVGE